MADSSASVGAYGANDDIVDFILGITFEIWEQGGVELCHQYYAADALIYSLDGITHGAAAVVQGTRGMLAAFPDRLLLGADVICRGDCRDGYSSHRILSPATNRGNSPFGPATGRRVQFMNVADCVIQDGRVTLEWLARDNLALVKQQGFDPLASACKLAEARTDELDNWFKSEASRVAGAGLKVEAAPYAQDSTEAFARDVMTANWVSGERQTIEAAYAPYAVAHRSPIDVISGRTSIVDHYAQLRNAFTISGISVDHVAMQTWGEAGDRVALRWAVAATHSGEYQGIAATSKPVFIFGVTHWRIVAGRIVSEWTIFDSLAVMGQLI